MIARLVATTGLSLAAHAGALWLVWPASLPMQDDPALKGADVFEVSSIDAAALAAPAPNPAPAPVAEPSAPPVPRVDSAAEDATATPPPRPSTAPAPRATPIPRAEPRAAAQGGRVRTAAQEGLSETDKAEITAWQRKVALALAAAKTYPEAARRARHQGEVIVTFTIAADGRIVSRSIGKSSGHPDLDAAAMDLLDRIGHLPAPPPGTGQTILAAPFAYRVKD